MTRTSIPAHTSLAAGALSGALLAVATAQVGLGLLAFAGLVPLLWAIDRGGSAAAAAGAGAAGGLVFFGCAVSWVPLAGFGGPLVLFLCIYVAGLASTWAAAAAALRWLRARDRGLFLCAAPAIWVAAEFARTQGALGYPWHQFGYALSAQAELIQLAAFGGVHALSLWIVAVNVLLLASVRGAAPRSALVASALVLLSPLALAGRASEALSGEEVRVAAVQPEVRQPGRGVRARFDANLNRLVALSDDVMRESPDLIVWPESAYEAPLLSAGEPFLGSLALHYGRPLLTGGWRVTGGDDGRLYNSAVLARADGRTQVAGDKVHPLPFYEGSPATWLGRGIARLGLWPGRMGAGQSAGLVHLRLDRAGTAGGREVGLGVLICVDSSYPDLSRDLRRRGAELLVEISNEAQTGPWTAVQHAAVSRLRAVETGLPLVRVGNAGPTEWVDARGRVRARIPPGSPASRSASLVIGAPPTPFVRFGASPALAAALLPLLALTLSRSASGTSSTPSPPTPEETSPCPES
ncbi:MAG: apolipoprotein N-acyltransferase [Deltaproteobacteria bacterium]|nr:apolipoprotein N-acyltransferase [Deltaproteobacteria bacterium]